MCLRYFSRIPILDASPRLQHVCLACLITAMTVGLAALWKWVPLDKMLVPTDQKWVSVDQILVPTQLVPTDQERVLTHQRKVPSDRKWSRLPRKRIVYWSPAWTGLAKDTPGWFEKHCPVGNCEGTKDRKMAEEADAIVFQLSHNNYLDGELPRKRSPSQVYVAWLYEHADYVRVTQRLTQLPKDFINVSMTYRLDSHIVVPYLSTRKRAPTKELDKIYRKVESFPKKKLVAWFVSHCKTSSDRESYVKELQKYITVDVYGKCGPLNCTRETKDKSNECYRMLERDYKFYLSFENSICKDYVTEKLANIFDLYVVPVTMGGANYTQVAPPHSFINALDFESPRKLAEFLHFLDKNSTEYFKYFAWKPLYKTFGYWAHAEPGLCKLCAMLNGAIPFESHEDFMSWWYPPGTCTRNKFKF